MYPEVDKPLIEAYSFNRDIMNTELADKIHEHFSRYPKRTYPKGQILIFADENPEHIYYIVSGKVRVYAESYRGDEVVINVFKPPAFFPMSWAINKTPNSYFYKTDEPTDVHLVPVDEAASFIKSNPDILLDLLSRVYAGIEGLMGRMVHLMSGTARSRVIYEVIIECHRFGKVGSKNSYKLEATERDLAARSGLSRETVSREINKLKSDGFVSIDGHTISVTDLQSLEKLLGTEI